jgi:hypothetical protein
MAVKPIIIPLVADTAGLTVGIEALEQLGTIDAKTASDFKAASKAFADRGKTLSDTAVATDKLVTASKKLGESIIGGGISQAADDLKKYSEALKNIPKVLIPGGAKSDLAALKTQFAAGKLEVDALATSISLAKKKLQELEPGSKAFTQLEAELKASVVANELLNKSFTSTRSELKAMREALIQLEDGGFENTKVFENLAVAAGQLDDQLGDTQARIKALGSDTFKFDAAIQGVQGVAAAFSIASGAAALFGDQSEETQQALLKVNAAVAILNGLQQINQLIQKESAVSLAAEVALRRIATLQTTLAAAAESRFIVIRYAAIVAQGALNDIMAANPAGLLLLAISAVAGALLIFSSNSEKATDAQEDLKKATDNLIESLNTELDIQERIRNTRTGGLTQTRQEIAELQARGEARSKIAALESKALSEEVENARVRRETFRGVAGAQKEFDEANDEIVKKQGERRVKDLEAQKAAADEGKEITKKAIEDQKKATEKFLKDQIAANEAALIESRDGFEKLVAQIALINAKLRLELADSDLGPNERLAAELRAGQEIKKARQDLLGDLKTVNSQQLAVNKEGQIEIRKAAIDGEVLTSAQVAAARLQVDQAAAQERIRLTEQEEEQKRQIRQRATETALQTAASLASSITEIAKNNADAQIAIEQQRLEQGLITQQQFDQRSRSIRRRAAQEEKQMAIFQAGLALSLAILSVLKDQTIPAPAKPLFIALASVAALAQIAAIQSRPIPAFKKGTRDAPGGSSLVGEAGPELIYSNGNWQYASKATVLDLPKHAKVIPTLDTQRILSKYDIPMPSVQQHVNTSIGGVNIDYRKLGMAVGKEIAKLPLQQNSWDENGYNSYQTSVAGRKSYLNTKFRSPR